MRASRLLSIQMMLETRGRMSATALARALEVSVRTLHRDIDGLSAAGVPVYAERGRSGGFELMPGWKTTLTGLTPAEAQAVFLSGLAGPAAELGLGGDVQRAQLKVLAALPAAWRDDAQRIGSRLFLDPIDWYREAPLQTHLATVSAGVWGGKQLSIRYESWQATKVHTLHPLGLVLKAGAWYLVASTAAEPRTYKVANILHAELLDAPAKRPRKFDLPAYWRDTVRRFEADLLQGEAQVRATPAGLKRLAQLGAAQARAVAATTAAKANPDPAGFIKLQVPVESTEHAARALLALAPEVEVLGPAALRRAIGKQLRLQCRLYAAEKS